MVNVTPSRNEAVVIVHGLWMRSPVMLLLGRRLRKAGFVPYYFNYATRLKDVKGAAPQLAKLIRHQVRENTIHIVAHSLGGLVALTMLQNAADVRMGRVVTLGSPLAGSSVAQTLRKTRWGTWLLGGALDILCEGVCSVPNGVEVGAVAGTIPIGLGRFLAHMPLPNDGTVSESESSLAGCADSISLPVSHFGLLVAQSVVYQTTLFLRTGKFLQPA